MTDIRAALDSALCDPNDNLLGRVTGISRILNTVIKNHCPLDGSENAQTMLRGVNLAGSKDPPKHMREQRENIQGERRGGTHVMHAESPRDGVISVSLTHCICYKKVLNALRIQNKSNLNVNISTYNVR